MIVLDASAALELLLGSGQGARVHERIASANETLHVPHLIDLEIANAMRRWVGQGRITAKVTATGTVSALVTVQVGSQVSGRIAMLAADFNSQVKKGQVIAKIDPELRQYLVQELEVAAGADGNIDTREAALIESVRAALFFAS